jgi:hypothetical protein
VTVTLFVAIWVVAVLGVHLTIALLAPEKFS